MLQIIPLSWLKMVWCCDRETPFSFIEPGIGSYKFNFKEYNNGNASQFHTTEAISRAVEVGISAGYRF